MKKHFFRVAVVRRVVSKFVLTAFIITAGVAAHAQTAQVKQEISTPAASVKYLGIQDDMLSVAVKYDNTPGSRFTVTVKDQDGYVLYQGSFNDKKFSKIFRLPKSDVSKVSFIIKSAGANESQSFEINAREVEEVVVRRVG